jgi:plastocyanin
VRRRTIATLVLGTVASGLLVLPAQATNQTVNATFSDLFVRGVVAVRPGETVTFVNRGGVHDVKWEDGFPKQPATPSEGWTVARRFSRAGAYRYYCTVHASPGGVGMAGVVYVTATGAVPPPGFVALSARGAPGAVLLRINATERSTLQGTLYRGSSAAGRVNRIVLGGSHPLRIAASPGHYRLVVRLASGTRRSASRTLFATVG